MAITANPETHIMYLSNRRCTPRFPFHSHGTLWIGADAYPGTLIDISLNGALFSDACLPKVGSGCVCKLTIYYAGKSAFLTVDGCIAHQTGDFSGIRFDQSSKTLEVSLRRLVDLNLGTPKLLKRDIPALLR